MSTVNSRPQLDAALRSETNVLAILGSDSLSQKVHHAAESLCDPVFDKVLLLSDVTLLTEVEIKRWFKDRSPSRFAVLDRNGTVQHQGLLQELIGEAGELRMLKLAELMTPLRRLGIDPPNPWPQPTPDPPPPPI